MLIVLFFRLLACLPLTVLQGMGRVLGRLAYAWPGRYRQRLRANATQAGYPDAAFARVAAGEIGAMMLEQPKIWFRTQQCLARTLIEDQDVIEAALAEQRGVIFLTPHLGGFEITGRYLSTLMPLTVMFRPPRKAALSPLLVQARATSGMRAVPATLQGVREFVRALRKQQAIGLLPDQAPGAGEGVWAPFFGRMAYTITLPGKLAAPHDVPIVLVAGERLPRGRGWRMHAVRIPSPLPAKAEEQAALINAAMEPLIRRFPQQYLWSYNRYKKRGSVPPPTMPGQEPAP